MYKCNIAKSWLSVSNDRIGYNSLLGWIVLESAQFWAIWGLFDSYIYGYIYAWKVVDTLPYLYYYLPIK